MRRNPFVHCWPSLFAVWMLMLPIPALADGLLIFAASSLKPALDEFVARSDVTSIAKVRVSYAASSQLARQIEHAAPADIFISADQDWMDHLAAKHLIVNDSRADLLGNALVLIAPSDSSRAFDIAQSMDLATALGRDGRLAVAEPNSVPAGKYARSALESLGAWNDVRGSLVAADNVRAALNFVARGEAAMGIVYRSDTVDEPMVRVLDTFPASSHAPIRYPVAIIAGHDSHNARRLLELLRSDSTADLFRRHGFDAPPR
ncbi:MAG: molybdate ABC transporter substrate-binding protein [Dokdonella sp.]